jgi:hypothetical protein
METWEYIRTLASTSVFLLVTGLASIIGVGLAIYFGIKGRRFKGLGYCLKSTSFVRDYQSKIPELELLYKGKKVRNVTLTRLVVWNVGTETIHQTDIAKADPLRIKVSSPVTMLNWEMVPPLREPNVPKLLASHAHDRDLELSFDFLDKNDGIVIDLLHTGRAEDVTVLGTIRSIMLVLLTLLLLGGFIAADIAIDRIVGIRALPEGIKHFMKSI